MTSDFCIAVHALVYLSHKNGVLSSDALAENICTNPVRIRKVLSKLAGAALVETKEGADGGYRFTGDAAHVTLADVAGILNVDFTVMNWRSGSIDKPCLISSGMAAAMDTIMADLNACCLERLRRITVADIELNLTGKKPY
ncbi:RrF2 family transcriptional regulator [Treponema brennaborense]|uniref:Transcriptional regulator, BadM/Rrf2 family n=1 Tax=Treponema brennaborense (strain DSM 12168 / CIP 105900 / DD5/3) TaxID=906968 RepID=F4LNI1_TREBD|nr:Rrf2 family transcriptional regulator [Treponema brennaborense]AEE15835.1 transcriptional regulator, BadM/Rrf2 family [Treponema brennaborense DSM 12168]